MCGQSTTIDTISITITLNGNINAVECRYKAVHYSKLLHKWLHKLGQIISQMLNPQKTIHTLP